MSAILYGVPGKLKTLIDRLTSARAAKLDNLDTTVGSRAPASTALSNVVWTDGRAGNLDTVLLKTHPLVAPPIALIPSSPAASLNTGYDYLARVAGLASGSTSSTTYVDIVNYSGQGVLEFCALMANGTPTVSMKLIIDGVEVGAISASASSSNYSGKPLAGLFAIETAGGSISLSQIPFYSSLVIQAKVSTTGSSLVYYKYRKTA